MPNPKSKTSKARRDKRRTHHKAYSYTTAKCTNCGSTHIFHSVCPECGHYRGKLAIEKETAV